MKEINETDSSQPVQIIKEPAIVTYDAQELTAQVAFAGKQSNPPSDRNLKENLRDVDTNQTLRRVVGTGRTLDDPEVSTFDKAELTTEVAFAGNMSNPRSDRNLKENMRSVDVNRTLHGVVGVGRKLDEPNVSTYDKAELATEVAFAAQSSPHSDRNLKENMCSVDVNRTLHGVVGIGRKLDEPNVSTYDKTELTAEVAFAGASPHGLSDLNLKENMRSVDVNRTLHGVVGAVRKLDEPDVSTFDKAEMTTEVAFAGLSQGTSDRNMKDNIGPVDVKGVLHGVVEKSLHLADPEVSTYDKAELTAEVAFAGGSGGVGSDRNIKENLEQTEPKHILSRIVGGGNAPADPQVTTYDRVELTARTVFTGKVTQMDSARDLKANFETVDTAVMLKKLLNLFA